MAIAPDKPRCKATTRAGNPCRQPSIPGGRVCRYHGGAAPQVQAAAQRRLAAEAIQADAQATIAHLGLLPVEDPLAELGKLASASKAMMDVLGARVNALQELSEYDDKHSPTIRAELLLYERSMDRTHRLLDSLVKHGYTERQVAISEQEAMLVAGVIRRVVAGLGLSPEQQQLAGTLLAEEFRQLEQQAVRP